MTGLLLGAVDPDIAREVADEILSDRRYHPARAPRPFAGFFRRLGELIVDPVIRFFDAIGDLLPDVGSAPWIALAALVVSVAALATLRLSARRGRSGAGARLARAGDGPAPGPDELERQADDAERDGDLEAALRLRFRAGLLRLDATGAVRLRPGLTNTAIGRVLRSPRFDELAGAFDEVVYGGRPATPADLATARAAWPAVLEAATRPAARAAS